MLRTIVVSIGNFVCRILEPFRTEYAECCCPACLDALQDLAEIEQARQAGLYDFELDENGDPLDDSLGACPAMLDSGKCGCDRPRWNVRPCGHCSCESECDDCAANLIWKDEMESWCGCAKPGCEVLSCGHCGCGNGLCLELVGSGSVFEARRKVTCS